MDPTTMTDAEIEEQINALNEELARRSTLRNIPGQVRQLRQQYVEAGGQAADLEPGGTP